ncbi:hypothetical protein [Bradyrhizobium sp. JYMT SZCCT0428]|uniref:hypothetical protein n=1 Tax=Bradyrhizobium sp. JYMT SZCCT0428 TaxID=2807673 RepID=UPI001BAB08BB|nr:hypothetical protein [Bradyrhizobium sp. JYMT SZCCT0428]MBR1157175.1 hypothetical protein [Bradyrhizobium sp. JYMT SZCCT0428]
MATLINDFSGLRTVYDATSGRLVIFDDAMRKQHRSSNSTFPDLASAKKAYFENNVPWGDWIPGWPELSS